MLVKCSRAKLGNWVETYLGRISKCDILAHFGTICAILDCSSQPVKLSYISLQDFIPSKYNHVWPWIWGVSFYMAYRLFCLHEILLLWAPTSWTRTVFVASLFWCWNCISLRYKFLLPEPLSIMWICSMTMLWQCRIMALEVDLSPSNAVIS